MDSIDFLQLSHWFVLSTVVRLGGWGPLVYCSNPGIKIPSKQGSKNARFVCALPCENSVDPAGACHLPSSSVAASPVNFCRSFFCVLNLIYVCMTVWFPWIRKSTLFIFFPALYLACFSSHPSSRNFTPWSQPCLPLALSCMNVNPAKHTGTIVNHYYNTGFVLVDPGRSGNSICWNCFHCIGKSNYICRL